MRNHGLARWMWAALGVALCQLTATAAPSTSTSTSTASVAEPAAECADVRCRLEALLDRDQAIRLKMVEERPGTPAFEALWSQQRTLDEANQRALEDIVQAIGWPKRSVHGAKAAEAAFLVVQHGPVELQEKMLPAMRAAVADGEAPAAALALLEDRVRINRGRPQRYGSQLRTDRATGKRELFPIEDEADVDTRRRAMGLEPLRDYLRRFGMTYEPKASP